MSASSITVDAAGLYPDDRRFNSFLAYAISLQLDGAKVALSHPDGTKIVITRGQYRNKQGTVTVVGKIKLVVLDDGTELMAVSDEMARKVQ